ncbi:RNA polymerase sigma factor [Plantactinospora sp. S1510]|uniref:RNA polymerase sigma factor n=1 Tax=Plantactinospora alkalitolerans TaxID=2789879 RepID=A0ABS0GSY6_9ACTN|nr:RNA polymerase sigma factor [Plantactinospora alkalitolerans]MBF9129164.1 RNA polymerase sigma factor [Plantactinospora alkalitolerans]
MDADNVVAQAAAIPQGGVRAAPPGFEDFYRSRYRQLMAYAIHLGASRTEADEVTSQTLSQMLSGWHNISDRLAWARRGVINNLIKHKKSERARMVRQAAYLAQTFERPLEEHANVWEDPESVNTLLETLTPNQRAVVEHIMRGLSQTEIALLLGRSYDAVRRTLSDVRRRLEPSRPPTTGRDQISNSTGTRARKEDR